MQHSTMSNKMRVRISRPIDLFPVGIFEPGILGTVEETDGDGVTAPLCMVALDPEYHARYPELEHWNYRIQVWSNVIGIVTAEDFEQVVVED